VWQPVFEMMCEQVRCTGEAALRDTTFVVSSPSVPPNFSNPFSLVGSSGGATVLTVVSQYNSLSIPE